MPKVEDLITWAAQDGIRCNGFKLVYTPGRGTGVYADRRIEAEEVILEVPVKMMRSINSIPPDIRHKLPPRWSIHSSLAVDLCLNHVVGPWQTILPTMNDFKLSIPLLWPPQLQAMLPQPALTLVHEQNARIQGQWKVVTERFPSLTYDEYLWSWLIMNTRTFYHSTPETETYEWLERIALLPVADLLNHAERGCRVLYTDTEYSITTDRVYNTGEEICNSYGEHTNDFLLGEYGFVLTKNCWDEICIDDAILSQLTEIQRSNLENEGLAKDLKIGANKEPCNRTIRAMQMLCSKSANGLDHKLEPNKEAHLKIEARALLASCLRFYLNTIDKTVDSIEKMKDVEQAQQDLLLQRWRQIRTTVSETIHQLTNTTEM